MGALDQDQTMRCAQRLKTRVDAVKQLVRLSRRQRIDAVLPAAMSLPMESQITKHCMFILFMQ